MAVLFISNYTFRLSVPSSGSGFANAYLPECIRPRTFPLNIGLNILPSNSFMSCLYSQLGYRVVPGSANECPCLLHVGPLLEISLK